MYLKIREAFGLKDDDYPRDSETSAKDAVAELIAHHTDGCGESLSFITQAAEAALTRRDEVAGPAPAVWDIASLSGVIGSRETAILIARLCGSFVKDEQWVDEGSGHPVLVTFEPNFLTQMDIQE